MRLMMKAVLCLFALISIPALSQSTGITVTQAGTVGIKTTIPLANLTVANSGNTGSQLGLVFVDNVFGDDDEWAEAAIYSAQYTNFNGGLVLATAGSNGNGVTERMRIDPFGNVGIGTSTPSSSLEVNGSIALTSGSGGAIIFPDGTRQFTAASGSGSGSAASVPSGISEVNGNVGIGTAAPISLLTIGNPASDGNAGPQNGIVFLDTVFGTSPVWNQAAIYSMGYTNFNGGLVFSTDGTGGNGVTEKMRIDPTGNVGIGTTTPGQGLQVQNSSGTLVPYTSQTATLQVSGTIALTTGGGGSILYPDGTVQATAWNGTTLGGDYAESVDIAGERTSYEPGDIIAIDGSSPGRFDKPSTPYSRLVAGVYSTKPGLVGRRTTADRPDRVAEVPMAMMGIVPTKVCTENGPVQSGDLLVSSSTPGYAMKGTDKDRLPGAIIGKALASLKSGSGVIEVLLSLQ